MVFQVDKTFENMTKKKVQSDQDYNKFKNSKKLKFLQI
jgi:hypothetical protein